MRLFQKSHFSFFFSKIFHEKFLYFFNCLQRVPLNFFDILQQTGFSKNRKGPPFNKFEKLRFFEPRYSADFRRSRLVFYY